MVCRHKRSDVHAIYTLIVANQAELPVASMCDCLQISKSGYYNWHGRAPSKRSLANTALLAQIEAAHTMSDATYGMPRIHAELMRGTRSNQKPAWVSMRWRKVGLEVTTPRPDARMKNALPRKFSIASKSFLPRHKRAK